MAVSHQPELHSLYHWCVPLMIEQFFNFALLYTLSKAATFSVDFLLYQLLVSRLTTNSMLNQVTSCPVKCGLDFAKLGSCAWKDYPYQKNRFSGWSRRKEVIRETFCSLGLLKSLNWILRLMKPRGHGVSWIIPSAEALSTTLAKKKIVSVEKFMRLIRQSDHVIMCDIEFQFDIDAPCGICAPRVVLQIEADAAWYHMIALRINFMHILAVSVTIFFGQGSIKVHVLCVRGGEIDRQRKTKVTVTSHFLTKFAHFVCWNTQMVTG